jgi:hypothetical protein
VTFWLDEDDELADVCVERIDGECVARKGHTKLGRLECWGMTIDLGLYAAGWAQRGVDNMWETETDLLCDETMVQLAIYFQQDWRAKYGRWIDQILAAWAESQRHWGDGNLRN